MTFNLKEGGPSRPENEVATINVTEGDYETDQSRGGVVSSVQRDYDAQLASTAQLYLDRQDRSSHPDGYYTNGDKWYPSDEERCWCCSCIRTPSWNWPWSLNKHCRSVEHVAALMDVDVTDLRRAVRGLKKTQGGAK